MHERTYRKKQQPRKRLWLLVKLVFWVSAILVGQSLFSSFFAESYSYTTTVAAQPEALAFEPQETVYGDYSKILWLDAGHGGSDVGTYVLFDGFRVFEKDITLAIVRTVYEMFQKSDSGITVFLTRDDDSHVGVLERTFLWNDTHYTVAKADLVVSVHVDFYEGATAQAVSGIQVNYCRNKLYNTGRIDIRDHQFAQILQTSLVNETGARDRGTRGDREFIIPSHSTMPAILIETGFMSNDEELAKLLTAEYRRLIARGIYNGVVEAFNFPRKN